MTKKKKEDKKINKCLFLFSEKGKWNINKLLKPLHPVYNGVGWFIEEKYRDQVEQINQQTNMRFIEWPLDGESFDEFRRKKYKNFFQEKLAELNLSIYLLKEELNISALDTEILKRDEKWKSLEQLPKGKQLLECVDEYKRFQEQLKRIEEEEKISNILTSSCKLKFISEISSDYFKKIPLEKPVLLEFTQDGNLSGKKIPFLHKGITAMLVAAGGRGKTHFAGLLAGCETTGVPFLSKFHIREPGATCLILGENDPDDIHRLLYKIRNYIAKVIEDNEKAHPNAKFPVYEKAIERMEKLLCPVSVHGVNASLIDNKGKETEFFDSLLKQLKEKEPEEGWKLIILDPASRFFGPESEKDNAIATTFIACLEKISSSLKGKPTILLSHHKSKAAIKLNDGQTNARGSSATTDGSRWQGDLSKDAGSDDETIAVFQLTKTNFTPPIPKFRIKKRYDGILEFLSWFEPENKVKGKSHNESSDCNNRLGIIKQT